MTMSQTNVVPFPGDTIVPMEPDKILKAAMGKGLDRVMVIGTMPDGALRLYTSHSEISELLLALERAKGVLMADLTAMDLRDCE